MDKKHKISVEEGMELTQQSLELDPGNLGFLWTKGSGYYKLGDLEKSLQLLLEVDLNYPYFNNNLKQQIQEVEQALGIPEAWFEPLQKLANDLNGYKKKNKLDLPGLRLFCHLVVTDELF